MKIKNKKIGESYPTFFIADIAANHDGNLNKAIDLIHLCAENGADAAKFQHFRADTIVSDLGFKKLNKKKITSVFMDKKCLQCLQRCIDKLKMD